MQRKRSQGHLEYADQASFDACRDQGTSFNGSLGGSFTKKREKAQSFIQQPATEAKINQTKEAHRKTLQIQKSTENLQKKYASPLRER